MAHPRTVSVKALAKINLSLRVLHKRADGYHELRTIFQTISLGDEITLAYTPARTTRVSIESSVEIPNNLAVRAAHAVLEASKAAGKVHLILEKRIPMGGGLGGGSTDAAAVLLALPGLTGKRLARETQAAIAASLGSDVPFFLIGGTVLGLGRGEELYPFPEPKASHGLLLTPAIHVSTPEAYHALGRTPEPVSAAGYAAGSWRIREGAGLDQWRPLCVNDFEEAVFRRHPELGRLRRRMERAGARIARMTGSGSAIFGLFGSKQQAIDAAKQFGDTPHTLFRTVDKRQYDRLWGEALP
jgi:4-diphosphocytidyl-2-C-methyl-D-erythritol kinase